MQPIFVQRCREVRERCAVFPRPASSATELLQHPYVPLSLPPIPDRLWRLRPESYPHAFWLDRWLTVGTEQRRLSAYWYFASRSVLAAALLTKIEIVLVSDFTNEPFAVHHKCGELMKRNHDSLFKPFIMLRGGLHIPTNRFIACSHLTDLRTPTVGGPGV